MSHSGLISQHADLTSQKVAAQTNNHEIYIVSMDEMQNAINSLPPNKRTKAQAVWETIKTPTAMGASYYSSSTDAAKLAKLVREMGGFTTKAYIKSYKGQPHIILKGSPGLRKILTGTRYGIKNPKIIKMGIGREAGLVAARSGGILSVILVTLYRVIDYFLTDEQTLFQFIGALAVDIVKIAIIVGLSIFVAKLAILSTLVVGTMVAIVFVGVVVGYALNLIDDELQITKRVIEALEALAEKTPTLDELKTKITTTITKLDETKTTYIQERKNEISRALGRASRDAFDFVLDSAKHTVVNLARNTIRRTIKNLPRQR